MLRRIVIQDLTGCKRGYIFWLFFRKIPERHLLFPGDYSGTSTIPSITSPPFVSANQAFKP
jgi:hypothetical protein